VCNFLIYLISFAFHVRIRVGVCREKYGERKKTKIQRQFGTCTLAILHAITTLFKSAITIHRCPERPWFGWHSSTCAKKSCFENNILSLGIRSQLFFMGTRLIFSHTHLDCHFIALESRPGSLFRFVKMENCLAGSLSWSQDQPLSGSRRTS
jgi:hypothetical protein